MRVSSSSPGTTNGTYPTCNTSSSGQQGGKPIRVMFWGKVSDEVAARLAEDSSKLRPQDWKSGDNLWVVKFIAPFGGAEEMVADLKAKVFANRTISMLAIKDGMRKVKVV